MRRIWSKLSSGFMLRSGFDEMVNRVIKKKIQLQILAKGGRVEDDFPNDTLK